MKIKVCMSCRFFKIEFGRGTLCASGVAAQVCTPSICVAVFCIFRVIFPELMTVNFPFRNARCRSRCFYSFRLNVFPASFLVILNSAVSVSCASVAT